MELPSGKSTALYSSKKAILPMLTLILLTTIPLYLYNNSPFITRSVEIRINSSVPLFQKNNLSLALHSPQNTTNDSTNVELDQKCDIFNGNWVPYPKEPYYTNETKCVIDDRQNCMKFGRPDTEFMKWRWKPDECELPLFNAVQFLELVRGKTLAFVGDSVGRNQMQSLTCLLASAAYPIDVSEVQDTKFRRWLYTDYDFTMKALWSPLLDEADEAWATQIENVDIVIISAGQWGELCENKALTKEEMKLDGYNLEFYLTQVEELRAAEIEGRKKGLEFRILDTTEAMAMRPDGHPNHYGHGPNENKTVADCVHWCMPGPIDTWNEFLLQMLKIEED
ncbi:hypothetical protein HYC85_002610 [Camellia sinensis]|uniref:Trichome birefringence-like N-terminal domain-containing protein n=1 Tax=Camellia sinensis TaxID=4442 RepID=A0A7J7I9Z6_CAMSI|nr:hypothetical protein HYC85_002610 [Camellia sinensis]